MVLTNTTLIPMETLTTSLNMSTPSCIVVSINHVITSDIFMFVSLCILVFIAWVGLQIAQKQWVANMMYACAGGGVIGIFMRLVTCDISGTNYGLITTYQMWILPTIVVLCALILWMTRES